MKHIHVSDYNPVWEKHFQDLYQRIWPEIADVALSIEHIGSTAVAGLPAKPIIDLTIVVASTQHMISLIGRLEEIDARHRGDLGIPGREAFTRIPGFPPHNLYACVTGSQGLRNHIAVRDFLRSNPDSAIAYGKLKKELARKYPDDIDAYVEGKSSFLLEILEKSAFSQDELKEIEQANENPNARPQEKA